MLAVFLVCLFGLILLNVPICFSLILTGAIMLLITDMPFSLILAQGVLKGINNFSYIAIPLFCFAGEIMNAGGISKRIVKFADALIGYIRGGIGYVGVIASMIFAGVSGSAIADTSAMGSILLPIMKENHYEVPESTAVICAAGVIGPIIPPSIPMILFAVSSSVSVAKLFLGGVIPGVLIGLGLMLIWGFQAKKHNYPKGERKTIREVGRSFLDAIWALILPVIIMGSILTGITTPTESAVIAVVYAFVVSKFVYKEFKIKDLPGILISGAKVSAATMFVVAGATAASYPITVCKIPALLSSTLLSLSTNPYIILLLINILLLIVGCVLDLGSAILLLTPVLLPIVVSMGLDPIYFGVVMCVNLCIGMLTPPVGTVLYLGCNLSSLSLEQMVRPLLKYILVMIIVLMVITYSPNLVMWLPNLLN